MWKFKTSVYKNAAPKPSKKDVSHLNAYVWLLKCRYCNSCNSHDTDVHKAHTLQSVSIRHSAIAIYGHLHQGELFSTVLTVDYLGF